MKVYAGERRIFSCKKYGTMWRKPIEVWIANWPPFIYLRKSLEDIEGAAWGWQQFWGLGVSFWEPLLQWRIHSEKNKGIVARLLIKALGKILAKCVGHTGKIRQGERLGWGEGMGGVLTGCGVYVRRASTTGKKWYCKSSNTITFIKVWEDRKGSRDWLQSRLCHADLIPWQN